jgi:Protein of unknown function (DUF1266)
MARVFLVYITILCSTNAWAASSSGSDPISAGLSMGIIMLIVFGVVFSLFRQRQRSQSAKTMYSSGKPQITYGDAKGFVPSPESWAMAAGAHHRIWYERPVDKLVDLEGRSSYKRMLEETWSVEKRDDLFKHMMALFYRGRREELTKLQKLDASLPQGDPFAFDLIRYLNLTTAGVTMGLISPDEGRVFMLRGARALQSHFTAWAQIGTSYMTGYDLDRVQKSFDLTEDNKKRREAVQQAFTLLETSAQSPWRKIPWDLPLPEPQSNDVFDQTARRFVSEAIFYLDQAAFTPSNQNWLLAVGAIYRARWGYPVDALVFTEQAGLNEMYRNDWSIEDREDLLERLMWLYFEGHRARGRELQRTLPNMPQADPLAWDLVRYIQLCMGGASLLYVQPDEAWGLMLRAGLELRGAYSSWAQLAEGFTAGRVLWHALSQHPDSDDIRAGDESLERTLQALLHDSNSPWLRIPWDQSLPAPAQDDLFARVALQRDQPADGHDDVRNVN